MDSQGSDMRPVFPIVSALAAAFVSLTLWSVPAVSDQLKVPAAAERPANRPSRGMSMDKVEAAHGAPARKVAPVGQPPIERWEYPGFTVYFEYKKVIHSVVEPS
jgi:hypothetical protein